VIGVIALGPRQRLPIGLAVSPLRALLIEKTTSTYSLSSVQLYIWLLAAVAAYLYLLASQVFCGRGMMLPDFPPNLLGIALISISTSVVATGVGSLNGGKGSGDFAPTPSDLITSGGTVAPERVQQLVWTLIAAPAVVIFAYTTDPSDFTDISGVPDHFLQLMGISSGGYLAGKIARGPGPKITGITATLLSDPPYLMMSIQGSDMQTSGAKFSIRDSKSRSADIPFPATILPTSAIETSGVATVLDLKMPAAGLRVPSAGGKWGYTFTFFAADGEKADWDF
jgi:hypothetical protein